jgi:glycosyltransferase involved in cell wall biosynthesis
MEGSRKSENESKPLLSVRLITYNHEKFIAECIEGILNQITDFEFEIVIGEDASEDATASICQSYQQKHPNKIRLFHRSTTDKYRIDGQLSGRKNFIDTLKACRGDFIALCDGDDYWVNPYKLQKQVDTLLAHDSIILCGHSVLRSDTGVSEPPKSKQVRFLNESDFITSYPIQTSSAVFKKIDLDEYYELTRSMLIGDIPLFIYLLRKSGKKALLLPDEMSVYRIHEHSMHSSLWNNSVKGKIKANLRLIKTLEMLRQNLFNGSNKAIGRKKAELYKENLWLSFADHEPFQGISYFSKWLSNRLLG